MKRVLRITAGIMGLWLILGVGGLAIVRAREKPQPLMLVIAPTDTTLTSSSLYLARFGSRFRYKLHSGYPIYVGRGWSPDGEWFYLVGRYQEGVTPREDVWRASRDGQNIERLDGMEYPDYARWTVDSQGLLIPDTTNLFRVNPETRLAESLTPTLGLQMKRPYDACEIYPTPYWIYFCAGILGSDRADVFRLAQGGQPENLTAALEWPTGLIAQADDGAWVISRSLGQLYIIESDSNLPQPLFSEWLGDQTVRDTTWIASADMLVVETGVNDSPPTLWDLI